MRQYKKQSTLDDPKQHIVQANLEKKSLLLNKYQSQISSIMNQLYPKKSTRRVLLGSDERKRAVSSLNRQQKAFKNPLFSSVDDYSNLILGLELALEKTKNKSDTLEERNLILESELARLRKILDITDEQQKALFSSSQQQIEYLESRIIEQKRGYEQTMESKSQILTAMEKQIRLLQKALLQNSTNNTFQLNQRILDLSTMQSEMTHQMNKKNILIQTLKCESSIDDRSESEINGKNSKAANREKNYLEELQTSNKLIMRKNIEILSLSGMIANYEKILNVIELYLDKKQVRGIDISIMEHPCVNKLRMLLREKNVFEKQLLNQLNDHNKKFATIQSELSERSDPERMAVVISDNRRLTTTIINLQNTIGILQKQLAKSQKDSELLKQSMKGLELENAQHRESIKQIQSSAKYEINEMSKQNAKLTQQNNDLTKLLKTQQQRKKLP